MDNDYSTAGFDKFLSRDISNPSLQGSALDQETTLNNSIPYDRTQVSGAVGDDFKLGGIQMSGKDNQITLNDGIMVVNNTKDGTAMHIGPLDDGTTGIQIYDSTGFQVFKMNGQTWYWYDKNTQKNVMQIGKLPDGSYGMVVAKSGYNVSELF